MQRYQGMPASSGVAIGPVWVYHPIELHIEQRRVTDSQGEWQRLERAIQQTKIQLQTLKARALESAGEKEAAIFEAHALFLEDVELLDMLRKSIHEEEINAESAVETCFEHYASMLLALDNAYFQARAQDVRDVKQQLLRMLSDQEKEMGIAPPYPAVIIAEDLTPSDTIQFRRDFILGLGTMRGGPTSHTAILARALGVPAVVSAPIHIDAIAPEAIAVVDGDKGEIIINPSEEVLAQARIARQRQQALHTIAICTAHEPAITTDGCQVEVVANVGGPEDVQQAIAMGAEGIGLFRTEFLYLDRTDMPDEEEQTLVYRQVFELMTGKPVVVRTLDIGGDKPAPYLDVKPEPNPFLGWRAIRMIDRRPDVLQRQFRALLAAAGQTNTDLRIMIPLVSSLDEFIRARELFETTRTALADEGIPLPKQVQFGMMVETPAAALLAHHFAKEADFFSIGTNDLTQYTLAVDRTNERVAHLASPYHPAVLHLIAMTIEAAHAHDCWVGLCGELAGEVLAVPLLLGFGLDEFSMAPVSIPTIKVEIRRWNRKQCQEIARAALSLPTTQAVKSFLQEIEP